MISKTAKLSPKLFQTLPEKPTRQGYGEGLVEAGALNKEVVVLCCDLTESTRSNLFKEAYPERFVQMGISEQAMAGIASGMALSGKVPFISSYAAFSPGRNWEQIRTLIGLQNTNVKICGAHAGVSVGPDGATHQALEDIATMRVIPNMTVIVPCDVHEARKATVASASMQGPVYLRFARANSPVFTTTQTPFKIGKAEIYREGRDVTIIATGPILYEALKATEILSKKFKIEARVINCHTIKPLDEKTILSSAKECGAIVTCEEAQIAGGLGGAIAELLAERLPTPMERIGMKDCYGESGEPQELLEHFGLTAPAIVKAVQNVLKRKRL
ncbi:MAG: Transketolase central region [Candidatus Giovannonibacteria bacterium GW2011_GWA2_53_7]|uniref:Transketolase central region n=1 Tax=Candidatus Giovannonibacteria bacterium GW2011_GWA2_53_7 TaxID=1618650 RepID=A0A0G2AT05_9BACT|nr:MAG: Transketolase central region [Candidatus Giovannonibacteria bacterium GW2011_GWA2_53_7]